MDFQFDATADGRRLKFLNVIDEHSLLCLAIRVGRRCKAKDVVAVLEAADYAALLQYRDLGPGRSLSQAADITGRSESTLRRLAKRWEWQKRLEAYDARFLARAAVIGAEAEQARHRAQLVAYRDAQHHRAERLADAAEQLLELVVESSRKHLAAGTLLQPGQLGASLTAAARALEASGTTAAMALGIDDLMEQLLVDSPEQKQ